MVCLRGQNEQHSQGGRSDDALICHPSPASRPLPCFLPDRSPLGRISAGRRGDESRRQGKYDSSPTTDHTLLCSSWGGKRLLGVAPQLRSWIALVEIIVNELFFFFFSLLLLLSASSSHCARRQLRSDIFQESAPPAMISLLPTASTGPARTLPG